MTLYVSIGQWLKRETLKVWKLDADTYASNPKVGVNGMQ